MMRSMYAGVSGLKTHQTRMDVIGNNIANVNTAGFKASRVTFKEMLSQTLSGAKAPQDNRGGMNPQQVGLGVSLGSIDTNHVQGNLQSTGLGTDLAIQGNGYFIVNNGTQNFYTRAGALTLDENGNLVNASNGYIMQGWLATNGIINTNSPLTGIRIPIGDTMAP
ncbi:MAG TPA: flagellar hook-basal body complex protein, partial [Halanaerobiales bacterium]|nr:flagellar hook-basal body complex protein [Halanaerobiales bacterium]